MGSFRQQPFNCVSDELTGTIAELQPHQVHGGCDTKFNGTDGEYGKSACLWFAAMERCRVEDISPSMFLSHIDRHLEGDAYQWMRNTGNVRALICKGYMNLATESDVETFRGALSERFKLTHKEGQEVYKAMPIAPLLRLKQRPSEDLEEYYNRVRQYFLNFHGDDGENGALAPSQKSLRSMVVSRFVDGLEFRWSPARLKMRLKNQQIYHHSVSLHQAFKMAEAEIKIMNTEKEKEKEKERKRKLPTDAKGPDNAKKQKQKVVKSKLLPRAKDDSASEQGSDFPEKPCVNPAEEYSQGEANVQATMTRAQAKTVQSVQLGRHQEGFHRTLSARMRQRVPGLCAYPRSETE